jgi:hypothetical protein
VGKPAVKRHLAAFETRPNATARTGSLALVPTATGFAVSAAFAATDSLAPLNRPWCI